MEILLKIFIVGLHEYRTFQLKKWYGKYFKSFYVDMKQMRLNNVKILNEISSSIFKWVFKSHQSFVSKDARMQGKCIVGGTRIYSGIPFKQLSCQSWRMNYSVTLPNVFSDYFLFEILKMEYPSLTKIYFIETSNKIKKNNNF